MAGYIIGVDIGTSGCRALLCDDEGKVLGKAVTSQRTIFPKPGWAEQDPEETFRSLIKVIDKVVESAGVDKREVDLLSLSSVFHSLILLDDRGAPLTNSLIWLDTRSSELAADIFRNASYLYERTGCPANSSYPLAKLAWIKSYLPEIWRKTARVISIKEYVVYRLTGEYVVDECVAGGSGLLNTRELWWDEAVLDYLGIPPSWLSPVVPVTTVLKMSHEGLKVLGLSPAARLVVGAGDGLLSSVGAGAMETGCLCVMLGTSCACRIFTEEPRLDRPDKQRTWSYPFMQGLWATGTSANNCGSVNTWLLNTFFQEEQSVGSLIPSGLYQIMDSYLSAVEPGADGLFFLPWVLPERGPYWDNGMTAALLGVRRHHTKAHIYRAMAEAISFLAAILADMVLEVAGPAEECRVTGGFSGSEAWMGILASAMDRELKVVETQEASAFGACMVGLVACGSFPDVKTASRLSRVARTFKPLPELSALYAEGKRRLMQYYEALNALRIEGQEQKQR